MTGFATLVRLAGRDLAGSFAHRLSGFRVLLAGLILGVGAVAAAGSVVSAVEAGLAHDARALLGGDVEAARLYTPLAPPERARLEAMGAVSEIAETRAMVRRADDPGRAVLAELKAVDAAWPLVGTLRLDPPLPSAEVFRVEDGMRGVAVAPQLLRRLDLAVGDAVRIGDASFRIRAAIRFEPDGGSRSFALGPRVLADLDGLRDTGLIQPGSMITWASRVAGTPAPDAASVKAALGETFRVRGLDAAAPGTRRFLDTIASFLTWAGLSALLVGGVGVASSVTAALEARRPILAVLKSQGATNRQIVGLHALVIGAVAAAGIGLGVALGALAPWPVAALIAGADTPLPAAPIPGLYAAPLLRAAGFGAVIAAAFAWWPLLRAREIPAASLLKDAEGDKRSPIPAVAWAILAALVAAGLALAAAAGDRPLAGIGFVVGAAAVLAGLRGVAWAAQKAVPPVARRVSGVLGRLALANLARRRSPMVPMMIALGLGATVLVTLTQVQGNVSAQIGSERGDDHPTYFFIDIQPADLDRFRAVVAAVPGARIEDEAPMVRGRVVRINGLPAVAEALPPDARWVVRGDRGLTASALPPRGAEIVSGAWWRGAPETPQVSLADSVAEALGLKIGDTVTVNVLGREITATVASTRRVRWTSLSMNFTFVFSPGVIDAAPHTQLVTVKATPAAEAPLERAVARELPNVSAVRVADVLERVQGISDVGGRAVLAVTGVTVLAGLFVLGGAVSSGLRDRLNQAVVLKVLGARRRDLMRVTAWEFLAIGGIVGGFAVLAGSAAAWAVVVHLMRLEFAVRPAEAVAVALACAAAGLATGATISGRILAARPARRLRHL